MFRTKVVVNLLKLKKREKWCISMTKTKHVQEDPLNRPNIYRILTCYQKWMTVRLCAEVIEVAHLWNPHNSIVLQLNNCKRCVYGEHLEVQFISPHKKLRDRRVFVNRNWLRVTFNTVYQSEVSAFRHTYWGNRIDCFFQGMSSTGMSALRQYEQN